MIAARARESLGEQPGLALCLSERRRGDRGEGQRAGQDGGGEAPPLAAACGGAPGSAEQVVTEACEIGRKRHDQYMVGGLAVCQAPPPQAAGTSTGWSLRIAPSPGRPLILQKVKRPEVKCRSARYG